MTWDVFKPDIPSVAPYNASRGPKLGVIEGLEAAWEDQVRNGSLQGLTHYFAKADDEQANRARKAGVEYVPLYMRDVGDAGGNPFNIRRVDQYKDIARQLLDGAETPTSPALEEHTRYIAKLNEDNPSLNLKFMSGIFDDLRQASKRAEWRANLDHSMGGAVGSFVGAAVGALDPRTDPLNFLTLPVGGAGRTVATRLISQAAGQGAIEAVNQLTGVQDNRKLLGLESGMSNALWQIGGAAVGGAAIQGVGEVAAAGLRRWRTGRWFADSPNDPAPAQPSSTAAQPARPTPEFEAAWDRAMNPQQRSPLYAHRVGREAADNDMAHVTDALRDWGGPRPWEVPPPTLTRPSGDVPRADGFTLQGVDRGVESLDSIARRVAPDTFFSYDKLVARRDRIREQLDDPAEMVRVADMAAAASEARAQISGMRQQADAATGKAKRRLETRIDELEAQYASTFKSVDTSTPGTPEAHRYELVQQLLSTERQFVDMKPAIERAYAQAQNKWVDYDGKRKQIDAMVREGRSGVGDEPVPRLPEKLEDLYVPTGTDSIPEIRAAARRGDETLAATVLRVADEAKKTADEAVAVWQSSVSKLVDTDKVKAERVKLDKAIATQAETVAKVKAQGASGRLEETKLAELREQREMLDTFTVKVDGKEYKLSLDDDHITLPTDDGGVRIVTARQLMKEIEDDNNMLKAVTTCSLKGTS